MAELDRLFHAAAQTVVQAVHGLGGVGKSELALQYAAQHKADYRVTWWVSADGPNAIETGLAELAFRLHPDVMVIAAQAEAANWAMGWLASHDGWLVVLDNVEDRRDIEPLLAQLTNGHVLITTRLDSSWENLIDGNVRLDVLAPADAVVLLLQLSGQHDLPTAATLAHELGHLPLALQQAGAYLRQTRIPMTRYLHYLHDEPARMLATVAASDDAHRAVARTWSVTVDRIVTRNPLALRLLQLLACMAPDALPRDVLHPSAESADIDTALGDLASYNLITLTAETVTTHRLVQAVTRNELRQPAPGRHIPNGAVPPPDTFGAWENVLREAVELLCDSVPSGNAESDVSEWSRWASLSPHVWALAAWCTDEVGGVDLAWLLGVTSLYDWLQGRYRQAVQYDRRVLAITEAAFGRDDPGVSIALDNLAGTLRALGRPSDAEVLQRRALTIAESVVGPHHADVAIRLNNLAGSLHDLGRAGESEPLQRRALAITVAELGPDHPEVATRLDNLALSLRALGRAADAEPLQRRALDISETALGAQHPDVATRLDNLGSTLRALERPTEAEPMQRRALDITERALGTEHLTVATRLDHLALTLRSLYQPDSAEPLQRRALTITEAALGTEHPDVATRLDNLGGSLRDLGRPNEAEPLQRRALAITEAALGTEHPDIATRLNNLALSLHDLGRTGDAEPLQRRALAAIEATLGFEHPTAAAALDNYALTLRAQGRPDSAEPLQRRALTMTETALGPDHPDVARRLDNLAVSLHDLGRHHDADGMHLQALTIAGTAPYPVHPDTAVRPTGVAGGPQDLGPHAESEPPQNRAAEIVRRRRAYP